jgi:hypothetical protein
MHPYYLVVVPLKTASHYHFVVVGVASFAVVVVVAGLVVVVAVAVVAGLVVVVVAVAVVAGLVVVEPAVVAGLVVVEPAVVAGLVVVEPADSVTHYAKQGFLDSSLCYHLYYYHRLHHSKMAYLDRHKHIHQQLDQNADLENRGPNLPVA